MKKWISGAMMAVGFLSIVGWGSNYDEKNSEAVHRYDNSHQRDHVKGDDQADKTRQGNDEDIKRAQGDIAGRNDIHEQGVLQNDDRGKF